MMIMRTIGRAALALVVGAILAAPAQAAQPRLDNLVLSDSKDGPPKKVFAPNAQRVVLSGKLVDVASGSRIRSVWIAEKTRVAPPNYQIDANEMRAGGLVNRATFSLTRPNNGWPVGDYRVDLFINGKPAGAVRFSVAK